jgi:bifunctional UDP-N-acetylglucosamine pyrophosphorylase/glucosamine-1-phosphate N-acetyltransferase
MTENAIPGSRDPGRSAAASRRGWRRVTGRAAPGTQAQIETTYDDEWLTIAIIAQYQDRMTDHDAPVALIILAAGAGTRMRSARPKPLHAVGGLPMLGHVLAAGATLNPARCAVVVGEGADQMAAATHRLNPKALLVEQPEQLGTGHAVRCALPVLEGFEGRVIVLYADTPFLRPETLAALASSPAAVTVLGFETATPGGYGRLIRDDDGGLARIVEAADASDAERAVTLCNAGVMAFDIAPGRGWLARVSNDNAKGEYYLTDLVALARAEGAPCAVVACPETETIGVNSRAELAQAEALFQQGARATAMAGGATLVAPETVFLSHDTRLGRDVTVGPNVVFGPGVTVEDGVEIGAFCHLEGCVLRTGATVGPFARLRPGTVIEGGARVGNFVEIKNAVMGEGAKANHLAYIGDATVGAGANLGAGTITCNYDGAAKHRTEIGAGAFVGSNSALIAPLRIGDGAYVGSGSVITRDIEADALAIGRGRQVNKPGRAAKLRAWLRPTQR